MWTNEKKLGPEQLRRSGPPSLRDARDFGPPAYRRKTRKKGETPSMSLHMPQPRLNEAERGMQQPFRKSVFFNSLIVGLTVLAASWAMDPLPEIPSRPAVRIPLSYRPVDLPPASHAS